MIISVVRSNSGVPDGDYQVGYTANGCTTPIIDYVLNFPDGVDTPLYRYWLMESDYCDDGFLIMRESHYNKLPDSEIAAEVWRT